MMGIVGGLHRIVNSMARIAEHPRQFDKKPIETPPHASRHNGRPTRARTGEPTAARSAFLLPGDALGGLLRSVLGNKQAVP